MSSTNRGSEYKKNAAYYTPYDLALAIVARLPGEVLLRSPESVLSDPYILEPHVGGGAFVQALKDCGVAPQQIEVMDINPDAPGLEMCRPSGISSVGDFLRVEPRRRPYVVIGNPPFSRPETDPTGIPTGRMGKKSPIMEGCAELHVRRALRVTTRHVLFLLRLAFLESQERILFWKGYPPRKVWALSQRPSFTGGKTDSCAYGLFWWDKQWSLSKEPTQLGWMNWKSRM
jgi:hypothetical protein